MGAMCLCQITQYNTDIFTALLIQLCRVKIHLFKGTSVCVWLQIHKYSFAREGYFRTDFSGNGCSDDWLPAEKGTGLWPQQQP